MSQIMGVVKCGTPAVWQARSIVWYADASVTPWKTRPSEVDPRAGDAGGRGGA
jgi:hypothetical protein